MIPLRLPSAAAVAALTVGALLAAPGAASSTGPLPPTDKRGGLVVQHAWVRVAGVDSDFDGRDDRVHVQVVRVDDDQPRPR